MKNYNYYNDGYDCLIKIISETAHYDIVVVIGYCCIYAMQFKYHVKLFGLYYNGFPSYQAIRWITMDTKLQDVKFMWYNGWDYLSNIDGSLATTGYARVANDDTLKSNKQL